MAKKNLIVMGERDILQNSIVIMLPFINFKSVIHCILIRDFVSEVITTGTNFYFYLAIHLLYGINAVKFCSKRLIRFFNLCHLCLRLNYYGSCIGWDIHLKLE